MSFLPGVSAAPCSAPALGSDELVLEHRASAIGAVLALVEQAVVAELRRVRALGAFVASALYFSLTAAGSDSLIKSAADAFPRSSAVAKGATTKPVAVSLMNRRRLGCTGDLAIRAP